MFSDREAYFRDAVQRQAVEQLQADKAARVQARIDALPGQAWPFMITQQDRAFLRVQRIKVD